MATDFLLSVFKFLMLIFILIYAIKYIFRWIEAGVGMIREKEFKGFVGIEFKIAGFLMLLFVLIIAFMFIKGFLAK